MDRTLNVVSNNFWINFPKCHIYFL